MIVVVILVMVIGVLVVVMLMIIVVTTAPTSYGTFPVCPLNSCGGGGRGNGGGGGLTLLLPTSTHWTTLGIETMHTGNGNRSANTTTPVVIVHTIPTR